jgi:hypothetical protein
MGEMRESVEFLRNAREVYFGGSTAVRVRAHEAARRSASLPSIARPQLSATHRGEVRR